MAKLRFLSDEKMRAENASKVCKEIYISQRGRVISCVFCTWLGLAIVFGNAFAQDWYVRPSGGAQADYTVRYFNGPMPDAAGFALALRYLMADLGQNYRWERLVPEVGFHSVRIFVPFLLKTDANRTLGELSFVVSISRHSNWVSRAFYRAPEDEYYLSCSDFRFRVPDSLSTRPQGRSLASLSLDEQHYVTQQLKPIVEPLLKRIETHLNRRLAEAARNDLPYRPE
jgi:hypothetical protein